MKCKKCKIAWEEYKMLKIPAWEEYKKIQKPAWEEYVKITNLCKECD